MRWAAGILAAALVTAVFVLTMPDDSVSTSTVPPLPDPATTTTFRVTTPLDEVEAEEPAVMRGALPDATGYVVTIDPGLPNEWHGSTAGIVIDIDGSAVSVGTVEFHQVSSTERSFEEGTYRLPAAGRLVEITFRDEVLEHLGEGAGETITGSIRGGSAEGLPVLELESPFRWEPDRGLEATMETRFSTFSVRRGCSEFAAACSDDGDVQVIWRPSELSAAPQWRMPRVTLEVVDAP